MDIAPPRRQNKACLTCKKRKVRCDFSNACPCTPCTKLGTEFLVILSDGPDVCENANPKSAHSGVRRRNRQTHAEALCTPSYSSPTEARPSTRSTITPASFTSAASPSIGPPADTLSSFLERGIAPADWAVFAGPDPVRIVYVGTDIASLNRLVRDEQPLQQAHHFPFPQISPLLPWKPTDDQLASRGIFQRLADDLSSFPTKTVRDALVEAYFNLVHPGFPIIDEWDFRKSYQDADNPPPLLLFQSVLLVGAHVSDHPLVAASRPMVMATLFRRAKTLFDIRHENDRMFLVQSALLLAWHVENSDNVSANGYYWIGVACRIAFGLGMHRDLSSNSQSLMPLRDRRMYRRIFWTLLQAEVCSALEHGRPCMVRNADFDQPELDDSDFDEEEADLSESIRKDFCYLNIALASLGLDILQLKAPRPQRDSRAVDTVELDRRLAILGMKLPPMHDFWSCQLRINYNLTLLLLHRDCRQWESGPGQQNQSRLCTEAASAMLTTFETMVAHNTIRQCHSTSITALMASTIQVSQDVRSAISSSSYVSALSTHGQLERLMNVAKALSPYWPNAKTIARLCQSFCDRYTSMIKSALEMSPIIGMDQMEASDIPWQDMFLDARTPQFTQFLQQNDWMSTSSTWGI